MRGRFALDGVKWREWSAADRVAATYLLLKTTLTGAELRELYVVAGDWDAVATLDRDNMGQTGGVELTDVPVRGGGS